MSELTVLHDSAVDGTGPKLDLHMPWDMGTLGGGKGQGAMPTHSLPRIGSGLNMTDFGDLAEG